jgi:hypothetical protein
MRIALRLVLAAVVAVLLGGFGLPDGNAAARQTIWLHYDYMAPAPDGTTFAPDPRSIQLVVDAFAAHGIDLNVDPHHAILPFHALLDFDGSVNLGEPGCVNQGFGPRDVADFASLKQQYFHPTANHEWHYAIFGDFTDCEGSSGIADLPGDDFDVTLGNFRLIHLPITPYVEGGTLMHELGHNLGLSHGGNVNVNWKSNYLSVMNYRFQFGIPYAATPGSTSVAGLKLDYSEEALPTLDEAHLDETRGLGATLPSDRTDMTSWLHPFSCVTCTLAGVGPASGPIDWNGDGLLEPDVVDDLDRGLCAGFPACGPGDTDEHLEQQLGFDDWAWVHAYLEGQVDPGPKTFEHENRAGEPVVTAVSPASGPEAGGNVVLVRGANFEKTTQVSFGDAMASYSIVNDHTLSVVVPSGQGTVEVTVAAGDVPSPTVSSDEYSYLPPPAVASVSPAGGSPGTTVTIRGSNFTGATAVRFGAAPAPSFTVLDDDTIAAFAPTGTGTVPITVDGPGGTSAPSPVGMFTYAPTVSSVSPASGPPGTLVTIHGTSLASATSVCFGPACPAAWTAVDDNTIIVNVPFLNSALGDGPTVTVDVRIANPGGTSSVTPADLFEFLPV